MWQRERVEKHEAHSSSGRTSPPHGEEYGFNSQMRYQFKAILQVLFPSDFSAQAARSPKELCKLISVPSSCRKSATIV